MRLCFVVLRKVEELRKGKAMDPALEPVQVFDVTL